MVNMGDISSEFLIFYDFVILLKAVTYRVQMRRF